MRYYRVDIDGAPSSFPKRSDGSIWCSLYNGQNDPGAQMLEIDAMVYSQGTASIDSFIRIWGISLAQLGQASQLTKKAITVYGGMSPGLPLATLQSKQAGKLLQGSIFAAWGNWQGTEMAIDIQIMPGGSDKNVNAIGSTNAPIKIIHNMPKGTKLGDAIKTALTTALPGLSIIVAISDKLKLNSDDMGFYQSVAQYANYLKDLSHSILGPPEKGYAGVGISVNKNKVEVFDGTQTQQSNKVEIKYTDLVGQPTWISLTTIQVKTVMRADIAGIGTTIITLPPGLVRTEAGSFPQFRDKTAFSGDFTVTSIRHVGNSRQPSGASWVTIIEAIGVGMTEQAAGPTYSGNY